MEHPYYKWISTWGVLIEWPLRKWTTISTNSRLAKLFESVTVSFVPREKNTHADKLGRTQMFMSIPTATFNDNELWVCYSI